MLNETQAKALADTRQEWTGGGQFMKETYSESGHFWADIVEHSDYLHVMRYFFIGGNCCVSCDLETRDLNEAWGKLVDLHTDE